MAAESFFAAHPLVEPLSRSRQQALTGPDKSPRAAAQAAEKAQAEEDGTVYLEEDEEEEADEDKTEADYETMFTKTGTYPSAEFVENLFTMSNDAPQLYKTEDAYYVVVRRDLSERTDWLEENTHTIIHKLKEDAMTELLANAYAGYNVVINEAAKSAYDPKSLK